MFESLAQGFTGLALFVTQLVAPQEDRLGLHLVKVESHGAAAVVRIKLDFPMDPQLEDLIDAGMPLIVRYEAKGGGKVQRRTQRTLKFNTAALSYSFSDSSENGVVVSKSYPMILLALRDFTEFAGVVSRVTPSVVIRVDLLPGRLDRLNRTVDLRQLYGRPYSELTVDLTKRK